LIDSGKVSASKKAKRSRHVQVVAPQFKQM
jgi:hypothetical protein